MPVSRPGARLESLSAYDCTRTARALVGMTGGVVIDHTLFDGPREASSSPHPLPVTPLEASAADGLAPLAGRLERGEARLKEMREGTPEAVPEADLPAASRAAGSGWLERCCACFT